MLLASNEQRPRMLLNILQYTRQLPKWKITWPKISVVLRLRNPVLYKHIVSAACYIHEMMIDR